MKERSKDIFSIIKEVDVLTEYYMDLFSELFGTSQTVTVDVGYVEEFLSNVLYDVIRKERGVKNGRE